MLATDPIALQVLARYHQIEADACEQMGHYGSNRYHLERVEELKAHCERLQKVREDETQRMHAAINREGYRQVGGKIVIETPSQKAQS